MPQTRYHWSQNPDESWRKIYDDIVKLHLSGTLPKQIQSFIDFTWLNEQINEDVTELRRRATLKGRDNYGSDQNPIQLGMDYLGDLEQNYLNHPLVKLAKSDYQVKRLERLVNSEEIRR